MTLPGDSRTKSLARITNVVEEGIVDVRILMATTRLALQTARVEELRLRYDEKLTQMLLELDALTDLSFAQRNERRDLYLLVHLQHDHLDSIKTALKAVQ
jgi:hypothetical protein